MFRPSGDQKTPLDQLRWVTLGHHYDWTNKVYPENCEAPFPAKAASFFKSVALATEQLLQQLPQDRGSSLLTPRSYFTNYKPEASIVNYYRKKTTMGFHVDNAEASKYAPLISIRYLKQN